MNEALYVMRKDESGYHFEPFDENSLTICGKTIAEATEIIQATDIERAYDIKITMARIREIMGICEKGNKAMISNFTEKKLNKRRRYGKEKI